MKTQGCPTALRDAHRAKIAPLLPAQRTGRPRQRSQRQMRNAPCYPAHTGRARRRLPRDMPS